MVRIHLCSVAEEPGIDPAFTAELRQLRACAALDSVARHQLCADPEAAELVLFVESARDDGPAGRHFEAVRAAPLYRRLRHKAFLYSALDHPLPFVPGIFPSIERRWLQPSRAASGAYLTVDNRHVLARAGRASRHAAPLLASFVGCTSGARVRFRLLELDAPDVHVEDTTAAFLGALECGDHEALDALKRAYAKRSLASRFVLCPRGRGVGSIRLFETMSLGRAPVVLSDGWVPPAGPDWDSFLVRVPEDEVANLPELLRRLDPGSAARGRAARRAFDAWFAPRVLFDRLTESLLALQARPRAGTALCTLQLLRPLHAGPSARRFLRRVMAPLRGLRR